MPRVKWIKVIPIRWALGIGLCIYLLSIWGCSNPNPEAPAQDQVHVPYYILRHASDANAQMQKCRTCHGSNLNGGNRVPGCFRCHSNSLPITLHAVPYSDPVDHGPAGRNDQVRCFGCHGSPPNLFDGGVASDPDLYNIPTANCSATECHPDAGAHPTRWQGDNDDTLGYHSSHRTVTQAAVQESCAMCHQITDGGACGPDRDFKGIRHGGSAGRG